MGMAGMAMGQDHELHAIFRTYLDAVGLHGLAAAEAAGLHSTDWYALSQISLAGALTSGELATRTALTTGATTRLIDRLERAGHVGRVERSYRLADSQSGLGADGKNGERKSAHGSENR